MKKTILSGCVLLLAGLLACKNAEEVKSENAIDAARNFIQSALNGEFDKASQYMVDDSLNRQDLHLMERLSKNLTNDEKQKYKEASIRIYETRPVNDSATVIYYSNSYKNKRDSLKVVNQDGQWLVDFKYIFKQGIDSLP
jgi:citrate synthase